VKTAAFLLTLLGATALAAPSQGAELVDKGTFRVYWKDKPLGSENFSYETTGDSLLVHAYVQHAPDRSNAQDSLQKDMLLIVSNQDNDLRSYKSEERFRGVKLIRGLVINDTAFTSYYQVNQRGDAIRLLRPPGHMYVLDRSVFALYDFLCRNLHEKSFENRLVRLFTLGRPDTLVEATATDLGKEAIQWGSRTVQARKLRVWDPEVEFFVWISPDGKMLRWTQPASALRVEREAPAVKRRPRPRAG
jgi:hypothetical protein